MRCHLFKGVGAAGLGLASALAGCGGSGGGDDDLFDPARTVVIRSNEIQGADSVHRASFASLDGGPSLDVTPAGFASIDGVPEWSHDHRVVAFLARVDPVSGPRRLFVADPASGEVEEVSADAPANHDVSRFRWSPTSRRLAYAAGLVERTLWVVDADGDDGEVLAAPVVAGGSGPSLFEWSPDGAEIAFKEEASVGGSERVYVVNATTGARVPISGPVDHGAVNVFELDWAPDSTRVAFRGDLDVDVVQEGYVSLRSGAGGRVKLHAALTAGRSVQSLTWAPDASRIAILGTLLTSGVTELFTALPTGGSATRVSGDLVTGGDVSNFDWAPDASRIAFTADADVDEQVELFFAFPDGSQDPLSTTAGQIAAADVTEFAWSPDAQYIAYVSDRLVDERHDVNVQRMSNGVTVRVSETSLVPTYARDLVWSPRSNRLAFIGTHVDPFAFDCFVAPIENASAVVLTDYVRPSPGDTGTIVVGFEDDGSRLVFVQSDDVTGVSQVLSDPGDGASPRNLGGTFDYGPPDVFGIRNVRLR